MTYDEIIEALRVCGRGECDGCLAPEQACGALCTEAAAAIENLTELARENDKREAEAEENAADLAFDMTETEYDILCKELDRVPAADVIERPQWISVEDKLPDTETEVLVVCNRNGFRFVCPAIYEDGTVLTQDSMWSWYDLDNYETYSEENDDYFIPEGWWENRQFTPDDVYNNPVDCPVTHWMPLPLPPDRTSENCPKVWPPDEL